MYRGPDPEYYGPNSAWVREFLDLASDLSSEEASRADNTAVRTGFIAGHDDALAVALLVNAGFILKLNGERERAQRAAQNAIKACAGAQGCSPVLAYAAGMMAEAFVVRGALDPKTWSFVTEPWRSIIEIPPLYEGDEPELVAKARASRAKVEDR
jgi:hypothetical protein